MFAPRPPILPRMPTGDAALDEKYRREYLKAVAAQNSNAFKSNMFGLAFAIATVIGITAAIVTSEPERVPPTYAPGQYVSMKIDGRKGMVVGSSCYESCGYLVRFPAASLNTDVRLLGPDGAVVSGAYTELWVREFEVEASR